MKRNLPPLNAIKAFEAAGRLNSFSQAAAELNVTQGAISKQIKTLESYLNMGLFIRQAGSIKLTEDGRRYLQNIGEALDSLTMATNNIKHLPTSQEKLIVDVTPSFASLFLLPNLRDFHKKHRNIQVEIVTGDGFVNFSSTQADCALRCLPIESAPEQAELLFRERVLCIASKKLLEQSPITHIQDLLQHRLIAQSTRPQMWQRFFTHHGLPDPSHQVTSSFEHFFLTLLAAKNEFGLCLTPDFLLGEVKCTSDLASILDLRVETEFGYFWQTPKYKSAINKIQTFYHWLQQTIQGKQLLQQHIPATSLKLI